MNVENINQYALVKTINKLGGLASVKKELVNRLETHNSKMKGKKTESINAFIIGENKIVEKYNINKCKTANLESKIEGIENKLESLNEKKDKVDGRITTLWAKREEVSQVEAGIRAKYGPSISSQVKQANQPKFTTLEKKYLFCVRVSYPSLR